MHPSGVTMGQVLQECSWSTPRFLVYDLAGTLIYRVVGPNTMICSSYTEKTFTVIINKKKKKLNLNYLNIN